MSRYNQIYDGDWNPIPWRGFRMGCCDCGLVHDLNFRRDKRGRLVIQVFRNPKATAASRRRKQVCEKVKA